MHPEILSITLFGIVAAFTPGPNNFVAFYSGFNFGIKRTLPHIIGVTFGFPFLLLCVALGLVNVFKLYPLIQIILKYLGTIFLIYLAYKISFSGSENQESKNKKARKPSLVVEVDFGEEIGIKQSSAQITHYYNEENLKGKQVIGVCNFAEKNIAGVVSQVLILGSIDKEGKVILVHPSQKSENGLPIA